MSKNTHETIDKTFDIIMPFINDAFPKSNFCLIVESPEGFLLSGNIDQEKLLKIMDFLSRRMLKLLQEKNQVKH